jgi:hypothetical protein
LRDILVKVDLKKSPHLLPYKITQISAFLHTTHKIPTKETNFLKHASKLQNARPNNNFQKEPETRKERNERW